MVVQRIDENGLTAVTSTPEAMGSLMAKEAIEMAQLVQKLGLNKQ
jgi:hypothetical protein